jgi:hypothetical protein
MTKQTENTTVGLTQVNIEGEAYFKITNSDAMRPFFMSIVSDSDHWMFISSNGGLTAGRKNAEYALFPYYTDDKITESADLTGSKSIFQVDKGGKQEIWEPFSNRFTGRYTISRNLYKNLYGDKVIFEEENHDLGLVFRYQWATSDQFGFVKKSTLINHNAQAATVSLLDGIQNVMPYGVASAVQSASSNLVDAYKRTELEPETGLGIFALSAIIVDKAEPSEALKANLAWSVGLSEVKYLLSSRQLDAFRAGEAVQQETDVKAEKGAYFVQTKLELSAGAEREWMIIADVNKNHSAVAQLLKRIRETKDLAEKVQADIEQGTRQLVALNAAADALQKTGDPLVDARHFSNTLFNIMRGGAFDHHYQIEKADLETFLAKANKPAYAKAKGQLADLPNVFSLQELKTLAQNSSDPNFKRLCMEYMPLKFSRRHGDPSRPWNRFSINIRDEEDGSKILDYEGNWRDIFQNWEALALSYPGFLESMIHKFLNATTFDGYNPYRVTKDGFDWETIEPDDPWSYIGYWGDHQIIYLLKLLELLEKHKPGSLEQYFSADYFVYANVPYKIKPYAEIVENPKDTIDFDHESDQRIRAEREKMGGDGALLKDANQSVYQVNFVEKLLATTLAKLSNFIPTGGIWMNTQRPEWNDANNALVGNGVSMVTLYYLRRFLHFFKEVFAGAGIDTFEVSKELTDFYESIWTTFSSHRSLLAGRIDGQQARTILDALGQAASDFRQKIYQNSFSGEKRSLTLASLKQFVELGLEYLEHSIIVNERPDHLYHAYNLVTFHGDDELSISHLDEMLEGQVAVLSSGYLSAEKALALLDGMKNSALFRPDQYSYVLYPNKDLPGFLERNNIPATSVEKSSLLRQLVADDNRDIISKDVAGQYHFNGNFKNAKDLRHALEEMESTPYAELIRQDQSLVLQIFEEVFNHKAFTGRSGTFFGYEGLGSIYWHMVSKLLLAVEETCLRAIDAREDQETVGRLLEHFYEINAGIGVHKSPELYGAFPTDPYSHTPAHKGAQQPGMTGQVKEDILSRFGELGVFVKDGKLYFDPCLLRAESFLNEPATFEYIDLDGQTQRLSLEAGMLAFTYCQVPIVYQIAEQNGLEIHQKDGTSQVLEAWSLDKATSEALFSRSGAVQQVRVLIQRAYLK